MKWNPNKWNPGKHASKLNFRASSSVTVEFNDLIPLTRTQLIMIKDILRKYDADVYVAHREIINQMLASIPDDEVKVFRGRNQFIPGAVFAKLSPKIRGNIVIAIESKADTKEEFELLRWIVRWYGIERKQARYFKDYIPDDDRHKYNDIYDGPTREEFTLDHVGLGYDDQEELDLSNVTDYFYDAQAMTSAVENNSWSLDKVGV